MTNQSSIKYISTLLANPDTITEGDQSSIALFRQTFPYFVPVRYFVALEAHKKSAYAPAMLSAIQPYMGNWLLFSKFLKSGTSNYKYMPAQKKQEAAEQNVHVAESKPAPGTPVVEAIPEAVPQIMEEAHEQVRSSFAEDIAGSPVAPNLPNAEIPLNAADNPFIILDAGSEYINDLVNNHSEPPPHVVATPVVAPPVAQPEPEVVYAPAPVAELVQPAPPVVEEPLPVVAPREVYSPVAEIPVLVPSPVPVSIEPPQVDLHIAPAPVFMPEEPVATEHIIPDVSQPLGIAPLAVQVTDVAEPISAAGYEPVAERHELPIPSPINIEEIEAVINEVAAPAMAEPALVLQEEPTENTQVHEAPTSSLGIAPTPVTVGDIPAANEADIKEAMPEPEAPQQEPELPAQAIPGPVVPEYASEEERIAAVKKEVTDEWLRRVGLAPEPAVVATPPETILNEEIAEQVHEQASTEPTEQVVSSQTEIVEESQDIHAPVPVAIEDETLVTVVVEEVTLTEMTGDDALEILNDAEPESPIAPVERRDYDPLIFPIYTKDYFLQQGEKVSEEIPIEINELKDMDYMSEEDKSLMVVMSFSEWLLHFKNSAEKQIEESKDQRALKTMWQKEKLAAAMEEENEEIPENVFEMAVNSISKEEGLVSETLAEIYIKQGKYDKAIEMYRKLSLRNPQKNVYFARKIEEALKDKQS